MLRLIEHIGIIGWSAIAAIVLFVVIISIMDRTPSREGGKMDNGLKEKFCISEVAPDELLSVLLNYFGQSEGTDQRGYRFSKKEERYSLEVALSSNYQIEDIWPSDGFPKEWLKEITKQIKAALIDDQERKVGELVCFASARIEGYFRYKDEFQILPISEAGGNLAAWFPFAIQYSYRSSRDWSVNYARRNRRERFLVPVLNLLLNRPIRSNFTSHKTTWVRRRNERQSEIANVEFSYEGQRSERDGFSSGDEFDAMPTTDRDEYFDGHRGPHTGPMTVPNDLETSLDKAFALRGADGDRFFRAATWYYQATDTESASLRYIALVIAIESLVEKADRCQGCNQVIVEQRNRCVKCGQPRLGLSKQFRTFLETHVPELSQYPKVRDRLYRVRSGLVHGVHMLQSDTNLAMMNKEAEEEGVDFRRAEFIAGFALNEWLRKAQVAKT